MSKSDMSNIETPKQAPLHEPTSRTAMTGAIEAGNFLRARIEDDLARGKYASRPDQAKIRTRFPPEPNGYLHIGHAKSICLNFGLAERYDGVCHMRFDDTNPVKEDQEYVDAIVESVKWLGFDWNKFGKEHLFYASDYFELMYRAAEHLIVGGFAYVDEQNAEQIREGRGTLTQAGKNSPWRDRSIEANLSTFQAMRAGKHPEGSMILRAKVDMAAPNINLRDPALYRIRFADHHRTGSAWCIYPMYTFAHPIEDAIEHITHSICTLEFEDQRPFYDWVLARLSETFVTEAKLDGAVISAPLPEQIEFARLNLTYVVTSKRKLAQLVNEKHVSGWDDPRMPTLVGLKRRGYTAESIRVFCERIGVTRSDSWIDYATLEGTLREDLESKAVRCMAALDPIKLVITNFPPDQVEWCEAPSHPNQPEMGSRRFGFSSELWIERDDFAVEAPKGYHRLYVGNTVRLRYGFVVRCTGYTLTADGSVAQVQAEYFEDSKSGTPGSANYKTKGVITWVSATDAVKAEVRLYERLFTVAQPGTTDADFLSELNPQSLKIAHAFIEPSISLARADQRFQFERLGYFVADSIDHSAAKPVFNLAVSLKDNFSAK
jgi:glutaminyl-tRNA synthetase